MATKEKVKVETQTEEMTDDIAGADVKEVEAAAVETIPGSEVWANETACDMMTDILKNNMIGTEYESRLYLEKAKNELETVIRDIKNSSTGSGTKIGIIMAIVNHQLCAPLEAALIAIKRKLD